jgi:2-polyprenyl-6-methoxyphenol hydroxylase-like FAD-dependent oxidoreductase
MARNSAAMKIAISGAGIAGPTLAWWLRHYGHEPVLIEAAPTLRNGGYIIDFWGSGFDVAERMGLRHAVVEAGYRVSEVRAVSNSGRRITGLGFDLFADAVGDRYVSLPRGDLAALIHASLEGVETVLGDSIDAIEEGSGGARVHLKSGRARDVDFVVGADGLHSAVREIAFGPERRFEKYLGYCVAAFRAEGYRPRDPLVYVSRTRAGRQIARFARRDDSTLIFMIWREKRPGDVLASDDAMRAAIRRRFADFGWEAPAVLAAMEKTGTVYADRVSQIRMERWTKGRAALVGDAAGAVSLLAGEGSSLAMTEAYVLAGEIARAGKDTAAAFAAYEARMQGLVRRRQDAAIGFARWFAPRTSIGVALRNLGMMALSYPPIGRRVLAGAFDSAFELSNYP